MNNAKLWLKKFADLSVTDQVLLVCLAASSAGYLIRSIKS